MGALDLGMVGADSGLPLFFEDLPTCRPLSGLRAIHLPIYLCPANPLCETWLQYPEDRASDAGGSHKAKTTEARKHSIIRIGFWSIFAI